MDFFELAGLFSLILAINYDAFFLFLFFLLLFLPVAALLEFLLFLYDDEGFLCSSLSDDDDF